MEADGATPDGTLPVDDPLFQRLLGLVTSRRLEAVGKLTALEQLLARERDRVLAQFERRRREAVKEALLTIEPSPTGKGDA